MVSSPWVDGASATAQTMEWLATLGMHRTVVVLNDRRARRQTDPHHWRSNSPTKARSSSRCPWIYTCVRAA